MKSTCATITAASILASCLMALTPSSPASAAKPATALSGYVMQLQNYHNRKLDQIAKLNVAYATVDLARDGSSDWWRPAEIAAAKSNGKKLLAYFEIGSIEDWRPEYPVVAATPDLMLSALGDWPGEYWVRYWEESWWQLAVKPRIERAISQGFDGCYLDTTVAYEEIPDSFLSGSSRADMSQLMTNLIIRISAYAKQLKPGFLVVPQNSPELQLNAGYLAAVDGIGQESMFFTPNSACIWDWCRTNLSHVLAIQRAGKFVLAVDYPDKKTTRALTCAAYRRLGFYGYPAPYGLDKINQTC